MASSLELLRLRHSDASATIRDKDDPHLKVMMMNDVARAFFEAPAVRQVYVELPDEDLTSQYRQLDRV